MHIDAFRCRAYEDYKNVFQDYRDRLVSEGRNLWLWTGSTVETLGSTSRKSAVFL